MKVWFATTEDNGGAGRAALRTYTYLRDRLDSSIFSVLKKTTDVPTHSYRTDLLHRILRRGKDIVEYSMAKNLNRRGTDLFSVGLLSSGMTRAINAADIDLVQLFWICRYLSIGDLSKINRPLVWRFSDLWPLTYGYHYDDHLIEHGDWKIYRSKLGWKERTALDWKVSQLPRSLTVVCPSRWMYNLVRSSDLFSSDQVRHIPTGVDTNVFRPFDRFVAKEILGFKSSDTLLLIGAVGGDSDPRKGHAFIREVLAILKKKLPKLKIAGFGKVSNSDPLVTWLGRVESDVLLAIIFSAADLYLNGSKNDNFPQTVLEALSCGCPVAAFSHTGVSEAVVDGETGLRIGIYESSDRISSLLAELLLERGTLIRFSELSRRHVLSNYDSELYADRLIETYRDVLAN